jgi:hypothetical protein
MPELPSVTRVPSVETGMSRVALYPSLKGMTHDVTVLSGRLDRRPVGPTATGVGHGVNSVLSRLKVGWLRHDYAFHPSDLAN